MNAKTFEHSPFSDVYVPYIVSPNRASRSNRLRAIWETMSNSSLPFMSRWVIYTALRGW